MKLLILTDDGIFSKTLKRNHLWLYKAPFCSQFLQHFPHDLREPGGEGFVQRHQAGGFLHLMLDELLRCAAAER